MNAAEYKLKIFEQVLSLDNEAILHQIHEFIHTFLSELKPKSKKGEEEEDEEISAENVSFEEWNKQFTDNAKLDEYIPEYEMTLGEFRRGIYEAEKGEDIGFEELLEDIKKW